VEDEGDGNVNCLPPDSPYVIEAIVDGQTAVGSEPGHSEDQVHSFSAPYVGNASYESNFQGQ
jgi:hypothetical protein